MGNIKSITFVNKEVLIEEIIKPQSYFDDYEDVENVEDDNDKEESDKEESLKNEVLIIDTF